ncbi:MAG: thiamine ABC transporter substrate-binding protein [Candidatus Poseidoniaceae archaeon]|nr:thiamine ABC transporter substrate-binding protein [Candidatus Poseidoniaceae archaeon]
MRHQALSFLLILPLVLAIASPGCLGVIEEDDTTIRILTYDVYALSDELISQFEESSGYEVVFTKVGDGGKVLETALRTQGAPLADLVIGIDNSFLQIALDHDLYQSHGISLPPLHPEATVAYSGDMVVPYDWGRVCVNIDTDYADGENVTMPVSLWNLTEEQWKGKVAVQNPRTSTPGRAFLAMTVDYFESDSDLETGFSDWWQQMAANDVMVTSGWSDSYVNLYEAGYGIWEDSFIGGAHAVVSYCHSPGAEAYWGGGTTSSSSLNISGASFLQVEYAGISNGEGVNVKGARAFLEFLMNDELQATIPDTNVMYPASNDHDLPAGPYLEHTAVPDADAEISMARIAVEMDDWLDTWDSVMA